MLLMLSFGFGMVATASSRNANQEMVPLAVKELHLRMSNYAQVATGLASLVAAGTAQAVPLKIIPCEGVQLLKNCTCVVKLRASCDRIGQPCRCWHRPSSAHEDHSMRGRTILKKTCAV